MLLSGGWVVWPILLCSLVVLAISLERLWVLRRFSVAPDGLTRQFRNLEGMERLDASQLQSIAAASMLGELLVGIFERRHQPPAQIREYVETAGRAAVHRLNNHIATLGVMASVTPLLGLLGTVIGMIKVFGAVMAGGIGDADVLAGGIGEALVTTAVGISVAIPAHLLHTWFGRRVEHLSLLLEKDAVECCGWLAVLDSETTSERTADIVTGG